MAVAHLLLKQDRVDRSFVERHVAGFEPFAEMARRFAPEHAAEICDVPLQQMEQLAEWLGWAGYAIIEILLASQPASP